MRVLASMRAVLVCLLAVAGVLPCRAQRPQAIRAAQMEQILDFHSDVTLGEDATLQVTETIAVIAANNQIVHGIYRDFPTQYRDAFNNKHTVGFQVISASRDSSDEPFRIENVSNGKRVYIGHPDAIVPRGRHVYTVTYSTNRQIGFFKDHDELFWNVTGLGWAFTVQHASATVHLPLTIPSGQVQLSGFTGPQGSRRTDLNTSTQDSVFEFTTNRPLPPHEGLTILLTWPKGYFTEPTFSEKVASFFQDNRDALFLAGCFLTIFVYYLIAWSAVGRDPERGVVMARYEPPQNLSPAAMRYLQRMGFDNKTFAAAILDMAVRGYLTIKPQAGSYVLHRNGKDESVLSPDEKPVAEFLFAGRDQIWLHNENYQSIQGALRALKKWLAAAEQKTYFVTNSRYLVPPIVLSIVVVIFYLSILGNPQVAGGVFLSIWLTVWTFGVVRLLARAKDAWRGVLYRHSSVLSEAADTGKALMATVFALPFLFFECFGFFFLLKMTSLALVLFVVGCVGLHLVFLYLMKAPTMVGRQLMDQVEGFKMFLGAVDGDRLNRAAPPQQTPAIFEKFLPYALALDVEQDWANKFSGVLAGAGAAPDSASHAYTPSFYLGSGWNGNGFNGTDFASSFSSSLTSAISSSATAPGSGAGGGSGGSGGGGGGGGGGGW
jgi:uncharacterized membrane protein YgcG